MSGAAADPTHAKAAGTAGAWEAALAADPGRAPLRAGVIGIGWAGQQHVAAYAKTPGVELVAIAGLEPEPLKNIGDQYEIPVENRFPDWQSLVASGTVDVVSIATPTTLHSPIAVGALDAGIHVLSEKPMADTGEAARAMVDAAVRNDRVLDVSFNHRRRGDVKALKRLIDAGNLGDIYYAKAGWLRRQGIPGLGSWFTRKETAGGGPMMDIGVHMLDMALHLLGEPVVATATAATYAEFGPKGRGGSAYGSTGGDDGAAHFDVEDLSTAFLRLENGTTLLLESSWAQWIPYDQCYVTLYGSEGGASLEWGGGEGLTEPYYRLKVWTEVGGIPAELSPQIPESGGHDECVTDFLAKVASGDFAAYRGEDSLTRAVVINACYTSAEAGAEVAVPSAIA